MDVWMSIYNTTSQKLKEFNSDRNISLQHKSFLFGKYKELVGSVKLFLSLDQSMAFSDNHIIDSGLLRGLFRHSNDSKVRRLRDELKDTFFNAADNGKLFYVYDSRISGGTKEAVVKDRFNLTVNDGGRFLHSAAYGDENNWSSISSYDEIKKTLPEYNEIFSFLIDLLERIPKRNMVESKQKRTSFGEMLQERFETLDKPLMQDNVVKIIGDFLLENPIDKRNRSAFYDFTKEKFLRKEDGILHRVFTDKIYNSVDRKELQTDFSFEDWDRYDKFSKDELGLIYKAGKLPTSTGRDVEALFNKGKMFNFLASADLDTINEVRQSVKSFLLMGRSNDKQVGKKVLWQIYTAHRGKQLETNLQMDLGTGLEIVKFLAELNKIALQIPLIDVIIDNAQRLFFMSLTSNFGENKAIISTINKALSETPDEEIQDPVL